MYAPIHTLLNVRVVWANSNCSTYKKLGIGLYKKPKGTGSKSSQFFREITPGNPVTTVTGTAGIWPSLILHISFWSCYRAGNTVPRALVRRLWFSLTCQTSAKFVLSVSELLIKYKVISWPHSQKLVWRTLSCWMTWLQNCSWITCKSGKLKKYMILFECVVLMTTGTEWSLKQRACREYTMQIKIHTFCTLLFVCKYYNLSFLFYFKNMNKLCNFCIIITDSFII